MHVYTLGQAEQMDALIYPQAHPNMINFLKGQFDNFSSTLTDSARTFMERGKTLFEMFNGSEAMRFARDAVSRSLGDSNIVVEDHIQSIFDIAKFQSASLQMQRFIMANPVARELYHEQRIDGYSDTYFDNKPCMIKHTHYDYQMVMDGVLQVEEDNWYFVNYMQQYKEGDRELLLEEKSEIINTWSHLEYLIQLGKDDPTSAHGDMM